MAATLKDVALKAGVGISTVSYVINGTGIDKVGEETRKRILSVAAALSYRPSIAARGLRQGKTFLAGGLFPSIEDSFIPELLQGLEDVLNSHHYSLILCTYKNKKEFEEKCVLLNSKRVDGAIILPDSGNSSLGIYKKLLKEMPVVFIAKHIQELAIPYVMVDGQQIGFLGTEHLLKRGHRRIAFLGCGDLTRLNGYMEALKMYSVPFHEELVFDLNNSKVRSMFHDVITLSPRPTALFAYSDNVAAEIIDEAQLCGIKIPEDLSVVGTDGLSLCSLIRPRLSTVVQPKYEQGFKAGDILMQQINHDHVNSQLLNPYLEERDSVFQLKA